MTEYLCTTKHRVYKNDTNKEALPIPHPCSTTRCKIDWAATEAAAQHDHGIDLFGASQCSAECLIAAKKAKAEHQARMLEDSKSDKDIGGGYVRRIK